MSPVTMITSRPAATALTDSEPITSSASKVGISTSGMPRTATTSRAHWTWGRRSWGMGGRWALYPAISSWRKVGPGGSKAAIAYPGRCSVNALSSIEVKP